MAHEVTRLSREEKEVLRDFAQRNPKLVEKLKANLVGQAKLLSEKKPDLFEQIKSTMEDPDLVAAFAVEKEYRGVPQPVMNIVPIAAAAAL